MKTKMIIYFKIMYRALVAYMYRVLINNGQNK